ncbi:MAG TPA: hypothetical protein VGP22_13285, partial [Albitalea sp.]|nr:hypothetical protein [Albitalea sp.]
GWADGWRALDAGPIAELLAAANRGDAVALTLCGERHAQRFEPGERSAWQRLTRHWRAAPPQTMLESL